MKTDSLHKSGTIALYAARGVVAAVFLLSGLAKANDPMGSSYKMEEYLLAFGFTALPSSWLLLTAVLLLATVEFLMAICLLFGLFRKLTTTVLLLFLALATLLTFYIALANPISDCGCFGDVIHLSNWATFAKNILLTALVAVLYKWRSQINGSVKVPFHRIIPPVAALFLLALGAFALYNLPPIDFTPYAVGNNILELSTIPEGEEGPEYTSSYVMERAGELRTFTLENYPDSTWHFVRADVKLVKRGYEPPIDNFTLYDGSTDADVTATFLAHEGYTLALVLPHLSEARMGCVGTVHDIYDFCTANGHPFYCLTASTPQEMATWRYETGAAYPFLLGDDTVLRTMVRSHPGLILLHNATIIGKWSSYRLPTVAALRNYIATHNTAK